MHELEFRDYRQVAIAFMKNHLKYKEKMSGKVNAILDLQAEDNSRTAGLSYAVSTEHQSAISREVFHQFYLASTE